MCTISKCLRKLTRSGKWTYRFLCSDKELAAIRVGPGICHADGVWPIVPQRGVKFVLERAPPDAVAACTVAQRVACLDHEFANYTMEHHVVVVAVARMRGKVLHRLWRGRGEQAEMDVSARGVNRGRLDGTGAFGVIRARISVDRARLLILNVALRLGGAGLSQRLQVSERGGPASRRW